MFKKKEGDDVQEKPKALYELSITRILTFNILIAMFALVDAFEKQKKKLNDANIQIEIELIKKNEDLTEKQKKDKLRFLQPKKEKCRAKYGKLTQSKKFHRQMLAFISFGFYTFI